MPEKEPLLRFQVPDVGEVKAYAVQDKEGKVIVRTEDELEEIPEEEEESEQE